MDDEVFRCRIVDELDPVVVVDEHDHWSGFQPDEIARIAKALVS